MNVSTVRPLLRVLLAAGAFALALGARPVIAQDERAAAAAAVGDLQQPAALVAALPDASYADKQAICERLVQTAGAQAGPVLRALLDGRLYSDAHHRVVVVEGESESETVPIHDPFSGAALGSAASADLSRIGSNNMLRKTLKGLLAQLDLADVDPARRLAAVQESLRSLDGATIDALRARRDQEPDDKVRRAIDVGLATADLASDSADARLAAVQKLDGELSPEVYNALQALVATDEAGASREADERVRIAARQALSHIDAMRSVYGAVETLFFGLSLGSVLVLSAIGLAITFGVMGVINMAHGELMMLGAYTAYVMQQILPQHITAATLLSVPMAFVVAGVAGVAIERGIVRFLYGRPLETLLATFGLSLILQQLVRSVFSPLNRSVSTPEFMSGSWVVNDALSLTWNRLYIVAFMLLVFVALLLVLKRTSLGLKVRAVSQNRAMARAMGVRTEWIDALTFGLGSGVAGVAGVALSQLTNVGPNLGQSYIIDSFMVVVFGGVGSLWGTLISGMSLGVVSKLLEPYAGAVMAKILVLLFLILFIQRRPRGLFPQKGRAAEG
ncbi:urea ABC transporter permease subunit UrtB [Solimonas soli]|uniref:urea ABC transporter permease subunit UrtB n=1 Tax=Solimonas soli TaxID=413479 RepID=UPI0004B36A0D|nr:urea ABC transporter permease subunit UrtB [Solimonas soli]